MSRFIRMQAVRPYTHFEENTIPAALNAGRECLDGTGPSYLRLGIGLTVPQHAKMPNVISWGGSSPSPVQANQVHRWILRQNLKSSGGSRANSSFNTHVKSPAAVAIPTLRF